MSYESTLPPRSGARRRHAAVRLTLASIAAASAVRALPAQSANSPATPQPPSVRETVVVLGEVEPIAIGESARPVVSLDVLPLVDGDIASPLRTDASIDIQQRAPGGVLNDVSIRGASFEQTLVLINGLRLDDVETSHFNLDPPVPMAAFTGMDVLHGSGSTQYGSDAIGGVIDLRTHRPDGDALRFRAGGGSYASDEEGVLATLARTRFSETLAADRARSEGFQFDRDYRTQDVSSESWYKSALGTSDLLLAGDERVYGANQFFGDYPSWEHTKGWFGALTQQFSEHTSASMAYRRHTDEFVLFRYQPSIYENNHIDQGYEGAVRDSRSLHHGLTLLTGLDETTDQIDSTNLGDHGRNRGAGYGELQWRGVRGSLSGGLREEVFSGGRVVSSPMGEGTLRLGEDWKLRGAVSYGFRLPTFLDLYYSDPTTVGNANLAPESAWNYEGGADWYPASSVAVSATVFTARQKNTIDYTRANSTQLWHATNLNGLAFSGVESQVEWRATSSQQLRFSWTYLHGTQSALGNLQSEYAFNYPVNNGRATWLWHAKPGILVSSDLGVLNRTRLAPVPSAPYAVWNLSLARDKGLWQPYVRLTNLSSTGYQEIQGVPMQPRAVMAGMQIVLARRPH